MSKPMPDRGTEFVREAAGLAFTLHDLRRTCATGGARLGASESTVSRILGHKAVAGTFAASGIYDRFDRLPEIRAALTAWSDDVEALIRGEDQQEDQAKRSPEEVVA
jgi:integrase